MKAYMITRKGHRIVATPYEEGMNMDAPVIMAKNRQDALSVVRSLFTLQQDAYARKDVDDAIAEREEEGERFRRIPDAEKDAIARSAIDSELAAEVYNENINYDLDDWIDED